MEPVIAILRKPNRLWELTKLFFLFGSSETLERAFAKSFDKARYGLSSTAHQVVFIFLAFVFESVLLFLFHVRPNLRRMDKRFGMDVRIDCSNSAS